MHARGYWAGEGTHVIISAAVAMGPAQLRFRPGYAGHDEGIVWSSDAHGGRYSADSTPAMQRHSLNKSSTGAPHRRSLVAPMVMTVNNGGWVMVGITWWVYTIKATATHTKILCT